MKTNDLPFSENEYGFIDLLNPRNSYSIAKCASETLCASYNDEYGTDSVIVRPGHIYGPTAQATDRHVSSMWTYTAAKGEDIIMKSSGAQLRSYCYCLDCASAIIKVLLLGVKGSAYNISNPDSIISIREMADIISELAGVNLSIEIPTAEEAKTYNPMTNSSLLSDSLLKLGWKGLFNAQTGFDHTIRILRDTLQ